jgi:UDP-N-acetylmuramate dehydrogenase
MISNLPKVRGEYRFNSPLANTTWFGVGGNAEIIFRPADENDLADFIRNKPVELDYMVLGVCSNVIIRDGGYKGCIIKLGRAFNNISISEDKILCGAACLDVNVARFAAESGISNLEFLVGVPGSIGGAIAMNAGAYGAEIKDILISAKAIDEKGNLVELKNSDFGFSYRKNSLNEKLIFTSAVLQGKIGDKNEILEKMNNISKAREETQPIRSKTGGSTFKNPDPEISAGKKAWQLIDEAGLRGYKLGGAQISEKHCNFLINTGSATAKDIEDLGELARKKVFEKSGIELHWEIKRIGER